MPTARGFLAGAGLSDGRLYAIGGLNGGGYQTTVETTTVDEIAPAAAFDQSTSAVLSLPPNVPGKVTGTATDLGSGVASVSVTFSPIILGTPVTATATVACPTSSRTSCTWSAEAPYFPPGPYMVNARATDVAGNVETPGAAATVLIL
jgi:hypothetical protein